MWWPQGHPNLEVYLSQVENELFVLSSIYI